MDPRILAYRYLLVVVAWRNHSRETSGESHRQRIGHRLSALFGPDAPPGRCRWGVTLCQCATAAAVDMTANFSTRKRSLSLHLPIFISFDLFIPLVDLVIVYYGSTAAISVVALATRKRRQRPTTPFPPTPRSRPLPTLIPLSHLPHARHLLDGHRD